VNDMMLEHPDIQFIQNHGEITEQDLLVFKNKLYLQLLFEDDIIYEYRKNTSIWF
jgi:hypothetical protein